MGHREDRQSRQILICLCSKPACILIFNDFRRKWNLMGGTDEFHGKEGQQHISSAADTSHQGIIFGAAALAAWTQWLTVFSEGPTSLYLWSELVYNNRQSLLSLKSQSKEQLSSLCSSLYVLSSVILKLIQWRKKFFFTKSQNTTWFLTTSTCQHQRSIDTYTF